MVEFGGWQMPLHYGSQLDEHHAVRRTAGMFDVSHMARVDLHGTGVRGYLHQLLANNIDKLRQRGRALYSCMLNASGGVIDDLIVYYLDDSHYRLVVNAATRDKDLAWLRELAASHGDVSIVARDDLAMIAVQGPQARALTVTALGFAEPDAALAMKPFNSLQVGDYFVSTTGYTGEDGFEIMLANERAADAWQSLAAAGVSACGLGARDTLRLEAGMNLYGADMDEQTTPLVSGLAWTVAWEPRERVFVGRDALEAQRAAGVPQRLAGLLLEGRGVLRAQQTVCFTDGRRGTITSGSYAPTLARSVALARVPADVTDGSSCEVDIRGKRLPAKVVKYPFVRFGQSCI